MRIATISDIKEISEMLYGMYNEVQPELASKDLTKYYELAEFHLEKDFVYIDEENRSVLIMRDITSPVVNKKIYDGVSVYIKPSFRKSKLLSQMYKFMFENFDGTIIGYTEFSSEHNDVLIKRHKLMGYVYELNRS